MHYLKLNKDSHWLYIVLITILAVAVWGIFQPGYMNGDAMVIYEQAVSGNFHDWHPPIMAFTLRSFLNIGLGLSDLMLLQCLVAYLGLYMIANQLFCLLKVDGAAFKAFLIVILLSTPFFPFPFYAMGFIKDMWCIISLLWAVTLAIYLYRNRSGDFRTFKVQAAFLCMVCFMVLAILARHNALVLLPVFMGIIFYLCRSFKMKITFSAIYSISPVLLYFAFNFYAYDVREVKHMYPERQVYAAELIGLIKQDSAKCESMEYICNHLTDNWREAYEYGEVSAVMVWGWKHSVKFPEFDRNDPRLVEDYYRSLKEYPFSMALVKLKSFAHMLKPSRHKYWFHDKLGENQFGLALNKTFEKVRNGWVDVSMTTKKPLFVITADHPLWFVMNIVLILVCWFTRRLTGLPNILLLILFIPLAYYFSYLLAATTWHYRFMYPSTILVQIYAIVIAFKVVEERQVILERARGKSRAAKRGMA